MFNIIFSVIKLLAVLAVAIICTGHIVEYVINKISDRQARRRVKEIRMLETPCVDKELIANVSLWITETWEDGRVVKKSDPYVRIKFDGRTYESRSSRMKNYVRDYCKDGNCIIRFTKWRKRGSLFENVDITISYFDSKGKFRVIHHEY